MSVSGKAWIEGYNRFMQKVEIPSGDGCWEWTSSRCRGGYGRFWMCRRSHQAHRLAYEYFVGPIPEGLHVDHLCRNRGCVNPLHLEAVTKRENILRGNGPAGIHARKTHCLHGHEFSTENTRIASDGRERVCRTCERDRWLRNDQVGVAA